jgi:hypothetical protein
MFAVNKAQTLKPEDCNEEQAPRPPSAFHTAEMTVQRHAAELR